MQTGSFFPFSAPIPPWQSWLCQSSGFFGLFHARLHPCLPAAYSANILLAFKDTFDNGDELLTDWVATPNSKPCLWDGVSCDSYGRVVTM